MSRPLNERVVVFLVGATQFVNILDFVMVMPLGPDFAAALGIPSSHLGYIGGSYTAAAGVSGLIGALFLDRFDRRSALFAAMLGLTIATAFGGLAWNFESLLAARVLAGAFGGPATSLSFSIIADLIPAERRGKAMGAVMAAFSVASVLGVPAGLELARQGGWRLPFFATAALGLLVTFGAIRLLPPLRIHLEAARNAARPVTFASLLTRPIVLVSYGMTALTMTAGFVVIPNIAAYLQFNLGYPRDRLGILYGVGGVASFVAMRLVGRLVDRFGSFHVGTLGAAMLAATVWFGFGTDRSAAPVLLVFVAFMIAMAFRNVAYNTLTSKVPGPAERARFMSLQSAVQHFASAAGAFVSSKLLTEGPGHVLVGMPDLARLSIGLSLALPILLRIVEQHVRARPAPDAPRELRTAPAAPLPRSEA
jgi:predicted MFS family arabinose efflux permease